MLQPAARRTETPRGTRTRLIASPSGTLCRAIAVVISAPKASPPPKATPTPMPSVNECTVITPTTINAPSAPNSTSRRCPSSRRVPTMKVTPTGAPAAVRPMPILPPSQRRPALAPSMNPAASAVDNPTARPWIRRPSRSGSAPRPVATAVRSAAPKTSQTLIARGPRERAALRPPSSRERSRRSACRRLGSPDGLRLCLVPPKRAAEGQHEKPDTGQEQCYAHDHPEDSQPLAQVRHGQRRGQGGLRNPEVPGTVRDGLAGLGILGRCRFVVGLVPLHVEEPAHLGVGPALTCLERVLAHHGCERASLRAGVDLLPRNRRVGCADNVLPGEVVSHLVEAPSAKADRAEPDRDEDDARCDASIFEELPLHGDSFRVAVHARIVSRRPRRHTMVRPTRARRRRAAPRGQQRRRCGE